MDWRIVRGIKPPELQTLEVPRGAMNGPFDKIIQWVLVEAQPVGISTEVGDERVPQGWTRAPHHEHASGGRSQDRALQMCRSAFVVDLNRDDAPMIQPTVRQFINGILYTNVHTTSVSDSLWYWMR